MTSKAEPRFDIDLPYGQQGELLLKTYLEWIADGNGRAEVKRKRYLDLEFYVEQFCDKGRRGVYEPSGINVTETELFAYVIADTGIAVCFPSDLVRAAVLHPAARDKECVEGNCPTRGKLVHFAGFLATADNLARSNGVPA